MMKRKNKGENTAVKMVVPIILWLLVIALAALPAVFMNSLFGYLPGIFILLLLAVSLICLFVTAKRVSARSDYREVSCRRGESAGIDLTIKNASRLFCPKAKALVYISDLFGVSDSQRYVSFTMSPGETIDFGFDMDMPHIGVYTVGIRQIELYDFFGAFKRRMRLSGQFNVFVTPRLRPMEQLHDNDQVLSESNRDTKITVVGGTDYTGVREYSLGDPMKQIHWNLSAHSQGYMTKLQESSRQQEYAVILDFAANKCDDTERQMDINDCLIETALSLLEEMSQYDAGSTLLYCDRNGDVVRTAVTGREADMDLIRSFCVLTPSPGDEFPDASRILQQESRERNSSTNAIVVTSRLTPQLITELQNVKRQKRSPELYFIVPAVWSSREVENAAAPLKQLEGMNIPYYLVSTSENEKAITYS